MYTQKTYYNTAKKTKGVDGKTYDSKFEAGVGQELELRKRGKDIKDYSTQVNFPLNVNGYNLGTYIADFVIHHNNGSEEILEAKGFSTPVFRLKWKLVEALYSEDYKITCVFMGKGKLRPPKKIIEY
jgi:hypothetical protein